MQRGLHFTKGKSACVDAGPGRPVVRRAQKVTRFAISANCLRMLKARTAQMTPSLLLPLAALIEPFHMHFAFMESGTAANIYLCFYRLRKPKLGAEGGSEILPLEHCCRCGQGLGSGLNIKTGVDTMERNQLKVERDWIVIQSVPGRGRLNAFPLKGKKHRVVEKVPRVP